MVISVLGGLNEQAAPSYYKEMLLGMIIAVPCGFFNTALCMVDKLKSLSEASCLSRVLEVNL